MHFYQFEIACVIAIDLWVAVVVFECQSEPIVGADWHFVFVLDALRAPIGLEFI